MLPLERARTILEGLRDRAHTAPAAAAAGGEGGTCIDSDGRRVDEILILSGEIHPRSARRARYVCIPPTHLHLFDGKGFRRM